MEKKKFVLVLVFCFLIVAVSSYDVCHDNNLIEKGKTPCEILTPASMSCSGNAFVIDLLNSSKNYTTPMNLKFSDTLVYNFSFYYNDSGYYWIKLCDNATANIYIYVPTETIQNQITLGGGDISQGFEYPLLCKKNFFTLEGFECYMNKFIVLLKDLTLKYWFIVMFILFFVLGLIFRRKFKKIFKEKILK